MTRKEARPNGANEAQKVSSKNTVVMEGTLWKKGRKITPSTVWNERHFVLRGHNLIYYTSPDDSTPKGIFTLLPTCRISDVYEWKEKKSSSPSNTDSETIINEMAGVQEKITKKSKIMRNSRRKMKQDNSDAKKYCIKITWPNPNQNPSMKPTEPLSFIGPYTDTISDFDEESIPPPSPHLSNSTIAAQGSSTQQQQQQQQSQPAQSTLPNQDSPPIISLPPPPPSSNPTSPPIQRRTSSKTPSAPPPSSIPPSASSTPTNINRHQPPQRKPPTKIPSSRALTTYSSNSKWKTRSKRIAQGGGAAAIAATAVTATIFTAGAGMMGVLALFTVSAAAAGGSGAMAGRSYYKKKGTTLVLATGKWEEVTQWKAALESATREDPGGGETWVGLFRREGRSTTECLMPTVIHNREQPELMRGTSGGGRGMYYAGHGRHRMMNWRLLEGGWAMLMGSGAQGLRIFREEVTVTTTGKMLIPQRRLGVEGEVGQPLKAVLILNATPLNAFMCLMSHSRIDNHAVGAPSAFVPRSQQRASFRIIQTLDDHMDIIHLVFRPLYLFPSWTSPRDYCLRRYWRFDDDGSYVVTYDSVSHVDCPPQDPYVRGQLRGVFTIAPRKRRQATSCGVNTLGPECLLTYFVQVDPKGWIPTMPLPFLAGQGYSEAFAVSALLQMLDVKDALDHDRFLSVSLDSHAKMMDLLNDSNHRLEKISGNINDGIPCLTAPGITHSHDSEDEYANIYNYDFSDTDQEYVAITNKAKTNTKSIGNFPSPLKQCFWAEPNASNFNVRGKTYKKDRIKINAGESMFRLIAVDIVEVSQPIMTGMCAHPKERVQQAKAKGKDGDCPPFVIAVNIVLPGPPTHHMVIYYAVDDIKQINGEAGTPFSKLANEFFFGDSDDFRDNTFKLIPQIVHGNFLVRKAVGSTPAIMGRQLKQHYRSGDGYFELILDVGSSSVAAGVVRLSIGYTKTLVTDMAFLLEGNDESTLPERVLGCCRLKNVEFKNLRFVDQIEDLD